MPILSRNLQFLMDTIPYIKRGVVDEPVFFLDSSGDYLSIGRGWCMCFAAGYVVGGYFEIGGFAAFFDCAGWGVELGFGLDGGSVLDLL